MKGLIKENVDGGKTPMATFSEGKKLFNEKRLDEIFSLTIIDTRKILATASQVSFRTIYPIFTKLQRPLGALPSIQH